MTNRGRITISRGTHDGAKRSTGAAIEQGSCCQLERVRPIKRGYSWVTLVEIAETRLARRMTAIPRRFLTNTEIKGAQDD
jgi:hypothetical protein